MRRIELRKAFLSHTDTCLINLVCERVGDGQDKFTSPKRSNHSVTQSISECEIQYIYNKYNSRSLLFLKVKPFVIVVGVGPAGGLGEALGSICFWF